MTRRRLSILRVAALLGTFVLLAAACGDDSDEATTTTESKGATTREADGTLTIATLLPFTGQLSSFGPGMRTAVELAVQDINAVGGVNGKEVVLLPNQDDGTDPDKAGTGADQIVSDEKVDLVIGPAASGVTEAVIDKITGAGIAECSPSNTAASLSEKNDNGLYFRTAPSDTLQGPALVDYVTSEGNQKIAVIARNDEYGKCFADAIEAAVEESGGTLTEKVLYDPEATDLSADVDKVAGGDQDATIIIAFVDDGAKIVSGLLEKGVPTSKMFTADGLQSDELGPKVDPSNPGAVDGIKGTAPSSGDNQEFLARVQSVSPDAQNVFVAQSYDCVTIAALAAAAAKSDSPAELIKEVEDVTDEGEECNTFEQCDQFLSEGTGIAYIGQAGMLNLVPPGEPSIGQYDTWEFQNGGQIETIKVAAFEITHGADGHSEDDSGGDSGSETTTTAAE